MVGSRPSLPPPLLPVAAVVVVVVALVVAVAAGSVISAPNIAATSYRCVRSRGIFCWLLYKEAW